MNEFEQRPRRRALGRLLAGLVALLFLAGLLFFSQATIGKTTMLERGASGVWQESGRGLTVGIGSERATKAKCQRQTRAVRVTGIYLGRPRLDRVLSPPGQVGCSLDEWRVAITFGSWGFAP